MLENFYNENQEELENEWDEYVYLNNCEGGDLDRDDDQAFWEFVEDQMYEAKAASEGYL